MSASRLSSSSVNIFGRLIVDVIDLMSFPFSLAPPERDENGAPHSFRKDELLQFLRVRVDFDNEEIRERFHSLRILVKQRIFRWKIKLNYLQRN